ncbi:hypothetical protein JQU17_00845 [Ponticoccus sp. SC2-23]|uniref:hypothetical protein n=1 Tax=Alexandriicola marinus TaxID=2081710 RepID=UPI000FDBC850|nr:hypothetical protein [Alexandriicola marinus]MBM1218727.1 hypothetical protein [Ponticoccus sp. SC6-9]MBM1224201.1 hypothetical protein [Ponticoccus sp. SC6-15]MBM1230020.1 hypothetical protein [Ponticoccus sp. SC6-38]MBM1233167.1 hypothetical protein [Ponticoccus sp. SC6-45]MBM1236883.1 hypothetical protein [Ponticoccus sp. SC6-49]MBM1242178.1 hypothetical protein [Ponticoccus sp. SC2-64]MBM1246691.1 hypothetical protein [Ponticoccus sp. SC6-42]MBM1251169.1 hypothetical protein [Pontico
MTGKTLRPLGLLLRFGALVGFVMVVTWGAHEVREALNLQIRPENEQRFHQAIMIGAVAYVGLLAIPFVPGAEIGLAMLAALGPGIAPLIYVATVAAMMLAFIVGRFLPISILERGFRLLRMHRAADLIARIAPLPQDERLALLLGDGAKGAMRLAVRYRYVALALAVNTPGNSLIGGGGGIMMMAGLSGVFGPLPTFIAIAIAVSPVPMAVAFFGLQIQ